MTFRPQKINKCIILDDQGSYLKNKELQRLKNYVLIVGIWAYLFIFNPNLF
jgi:hypothetical protein